MRDSGNNRPARSRSALSESGSCIIVLRIAILLLGLRRQIREFGSLASLPRGDRALDVLHAENTWLQRIQVVKALGNRMVAGVRDHLLGRRNRNGRLRRNLAR